jgi:hypothetical protein
LNQIKSYKGFSIFREKNGAFSTEAMLAEKARFWKKEGFLQAPKEYYLREHCD